MDNSKEFRCISLCTGYGGIELGLRTVIPNLRTVCYVEVEAFACANLVAKIEEGKLDAAPIWTDIKTFDGRPFRDRIHLITGGYPCQPFATVGKRQGKDDPRHLWPYIEGIIKAVKPLFCFFENVSGHLTLGYSDVYRSLRNLGYKVEQGLFGTAECGGTHERKRLFILAYSSCDVDPFRILDRNSQKASGRETHPKEWLSNREFVEMGTTIDKASREFNRVEIYEPKVVGNINDDSIELDEIRLLGNGVVPQCAAKAWEYLYESLTP